VFVRTLRNLGNIYVPARILHAHRETCICGLTPANLLMYIGRHS